MIRSTSRNWRKARFTMSKEEWFTLIIFLISVLAGIMG